MLPIARVLDQLAQLTRKPVERRSRHGLIIETYQNELSVSGEFLERIECATDKLPQPITEFLRDENCKIAAVRTNRAFHEFSSTYKNDRFEWTSAHVDGCFDGLGNRIVVAQFREANDESDCDGPAWLCAHFPERTLFHEVGHALDAAIGNIVFKEKVKAIKLDELLSGTLASIERRVEQITNWKRFTGFNPAFKRAHRADVAAMEKEEREQFSYYTRPDSDGARSSARCETFAELFADMMLKHTYNDLSHSRSLWKVMPKTRACMLDDFIIGNATQRWTLRQTFGGSMWDDSSVTISRSTK